MKRLSQTVVVSTCLVIALGLLTSVRERSAAQAARAKDDTAAVLAQQPLGPLLGKQVVLGVDWPLDPEQRVGTLEAADTSWVRIRTRDGHLWCYSVARMSFLAVENKAKP